MPGEDVAGERERTADNLPAGVALAELRLSAAKLHALPEAHRALFFDVGNCLNEANWLRKLLVAAVTRIDDTPEGRAAFALAVLIAPILGGKMHEGWKRLHSGRRLVDLGYEPPTCLTDLRAEISRQMNDRTIKEIRNRAFHYEQQRPTSGLPAFDDDDMIVYESDGGYRGDIFSHVFALAALDLFTTAIGGCDRVGALKEISDRVAKLAGDYCQFLSGWLTQMISAWWPDDGPIDLVVTTIPSDEAGCAPTFFLRPPSELRG